ILPGWASSRWSSSWRRLCPAVTWRARPWVGGLRDAASSCSPPRTPCQRSEGADLPCEALLHQRTIYVCARRGGAAGNARAPQCSVGSRRALHSLGPSERIPKQVRFLHVPEDARRGRPTTLVSPSPRMFLL